MTAPTTAPTAPIPGALRLRYPGTLIPPSYVTLAAFLEANVEMPEGASFNADVLALAEGATLQVGGGAAPIISIWRLPRAHYVKPQYDLVCPDLQVLAEAMNGVADLFGAAAAPGLDVQSLAPVDREGYILTVWPRGGASDAEYLGLHELTTLYAEDRAHA